MLTNFIARQNRVFTLKPLAFSVYSLTLIGVLGCTFAPTDNSARTTTNDNRSITNHPQPPLNIDSLNEAIKAGLEGIKLAIESQQPHITVKSAPPVIVPSGIDLNPVIAAINNRAALSLKLHADTQLINQHLTEITKDIVNQENASAQLILTVTELANVIKKQAKADSEKTFKFRDFLNTFLGASAAFLLHWIGVIQVKRKESRQEMVQLRALAKELLVNSKSITIWLKANIKTFNPDLGQAADGSISPTPAQLDAFAPEIVHWPDMLEQICKQLDFGHLFGTGLTQDIIQLRANTGTAQSFSSPKQRIAILETLGNDGQPILTLMFLAGMYNLGVQFLYLSYRVKQIANETQLTDQSETSYIEPIHFLGHATVKDIIMSSPQSSATDEELANENPTTSEESPNQDSGETNFLMSILHKLLKDAEEDQKAIAKNLLLDTTEKAQEALDSMRNDTKEYASYKEDIEDLKALDKGIGEILSHLFGNALNKRQHNQ